MLSAIALDRIGFGLALVLAFSLGLAGVLTGIGLLFVYAGRLLDRVPMQGRVLQALPVASALFIAVVGLGIAVRALVEMGLIGA
jgi:ABC-type nickel/cobalt efflux system permease component RcnA